MESFTNTCKKSLCPWWFATLISWSPPSPSQFTEVLSKRRGSLSSRYPAQCPCSTCLFCPDPVTLHMAICGYCSRWSLPTLFLYRNIANSLPNVALPKVPSLPLNLPQIPSLSTPTWMASLSESTCVFFTYLLAVC